MTTTRTKQQTACDGVRVVWSGGDSFTNILQHQVHTNFSIDGVIPVERRVIHNASRGAQNARAFTVSRFVPKTAFGVMDGVRLAWRQTSPARV